MSSSGATNGASTVAAAAAVDAKSSPAAPAALDWWLAPVSAPVKAAAPTEGSLLLAAGGATAGPKVSSSNAQSETPKPHGDAHCGVCADPVTAPSSSASSAAAAVPLASLAGAPVAAGKTTVPASASASVRRALAKSLGITAAGKSASDGKGPDAKAGSGEAAADGSQSLAAVFHLAQRAHRSLSSLSGDDKQRVLQSAFLDFLKVEKLVLACALISPNEEVDDIATPDLKYVLTDFYIADLLMDMGGAAQRLSRVKRAVECLKKFLQTCKHLKVLGKEESAIFARYLSGGKATNPMALREEKIAALKREQAVQQKLDHLLRQREALHRAGKLDDATAENDDDERAYTLTLIQHCIQLALRHLLMSGQELDILEHMARVDAQRAASTAATGRPAGAGAAAAAVAGGRGGGAAPGALAGPPRKPEMYKITPNNVAAQLAALPPSVAAAINYRRADGSLGAVTELNSIQNAINRAAHARETVFRDPNPATMTLDQYVDQARLTGEIQPAQSAPEKSEDDKARELDDDVDAQDKEQVKARKWADWTDEHERGAGNKMK